MRFFHGGAFGSRVLHVHLARVDTLVGQAVVLVPLSQLRTAGSGGIQLRLPLTHGAGSLTVRVALVTHSDIMCVASRAA